MDDVVFLTEVEAEARRALDFDAFKAANHTCGHTEVVEGCKCCKYFEVTNERQKVRERLDGKWVYPVCPAADYTGMTIEAYQE